ncbi:MAG: hypothetical protein D6802_00325 [Ardenticatenia bacterium]|nr:MAG: hypothetical protein D6802_00325 [Ardenticatenia bacterium]
MKCREIEPLLSAYALDALETGERLAVEAHLEDCAVCRRALADYRAVAEGLAFAAPPVEPPPSLRARLIAQTAPAPARPDLAARLRLLRPRLGTLALLVGVFLLLVNVGLWQRTTRLQAEMQRQEMAYQQALALLGEPNGKVVRLEGDGVQGALVYAPDGQTAVLAVEGLAALPPDRDYQLWLIQPDETRLSGGVFDADPAGEVTLFVVHSPQPLDAFVGVGVTVEPAGGSPGPTSRRVFGGEF